MFLSLPLLAAAACTRPAEAIYGGPEMVEPAPAAGDSTTPVPEKTAEADPPEPSEPQGEIYGSRQMMDSSADEPLARAIPAPNPDAGGNKPSPDGPDQADAKPEPPPGSPSTAAPRRWTRTRSCSRT